MNAHIEILRLFKNLSEKEKDIVLHELHQTSTGETVRIEEALVVRCPHCESKLFVKNVSEERFRNTSVKPAVGCSPQRQEHLCIDYKNQTSLNYINL